MAAFSIKEVLALFEGVEIPRPGFDSQAPGDIPPSFALTLFILFDDMPDGLTRHLSQPEHGIRVRGVIGIVQYRSDFKVAHMETCLESGPESGWIRRRGHVKILHPAKIAGKCN